LIIIELYLCLVKAFARTYARHYGVQVAENKVMVGWRLTSRRGVTVTQVFCRFQSRVQVFFQTRPNVIHFLFFASLEHRGYSVRTPDV
jgi:uncharacterized membrane protein YdbT with pleckstrin-like domain